MKDLASPRDFGAKGDGKSDDSGPIQQWFDAIAGGGGYGAAGTYACSRTVSVGSSTIYGAGRRRFVLAKLPGFSPDAQLVLNKNVSGVGTARVDADIAFYGCGFRGLPDARVNRELVALVGVDGFTFRDCEFSSSRRFLLAFSNSVGALVDACELHDYGSRDPVGNPDEYDGGPAVWVGADNIDWAVSRCRIHDGMWTGILVSGQRGSVTDCVIRDVKEAGIFGGGDDIILSRNRISGLRVRAMSAHGIEAGGYITIADNRIDDTGLASIYASDMARGSITGNVCSRSNQVRVGDIAGACGAITLRAAALTPEGMDGLTVSDNVLVGGGKSVHGIRCVNYGGQQFRNVTIGCNQVGPASAWLGKALLVDTNVPGPNFNARDNDAAPAAMAAPVPAAKAQVVHISTARLARAMGRLRVAA